METKRGITKNLRVARRYKNWTQKELAAIVGFSMETISRWERGGRSPKLADLVTLANALDVSVAFLTGETHLPNTNFVEGAILRLPGIDDKIAVREIVNTNEAAQIDTKTSIDKKESQTSVRPVSMEDFARTREASRNADSLDDRDLNAAEEMLLASLEAIQKEKALRTAKDDGVAKLA